MGGSAQQMRPFLVPQAIDGEGGVADAGSLQYGKVPLASKCHMQQKNDTAPDEQFTNKQRSRSIRAESPLISILDIGSRYDWY